MMTGMDPEIRPVRPAEFDRVGDLVVDAYAAMAELGDYEAVLWLRGYVMELDPA
jgi:hypothetical protein